MTKSRITTVNTTSFASKLTNFTFEPQEKLLVQRREVLYWRVYAAMYSAVERKQMQSLPDGWLRKHNCIQVNAGGYDVQLMHGEDVQDPPFLERDFSLKTRHDCNYRFDITNTELIQDIQLLCQHEETVTHDKNEFRGKTRVLVRSFRYWEDLIEATPALEEFILRFVDRSEGPRTALVPVGDLLATMRRVRGISGMQLPEAAG